MRTVDVGIGHDDDLVISQLALIEFFTDSCAERHNDRLELLIGIHLIDTGLLDVEHLTPERQDGLILTLSSLLCRSACGVSLYDEDLTELSLIGLAVCKIARKRVVLEYSLPSGELSGSLGRRERVLLCNEEA